MFVRALKQWEGDFWSSPYIHRGPVGSLNFFLAMVTPSLMFAVLLLTALAVYSAYLRGTNQQPAA